MEPVVRREQKDLFIQSTSYGNIAWKLNLPLVDPVKAGSRVTLAIKEFQVPQSLGRALQELAQVESVALHSLYMTALQILLYRYTHEREFVIATSFAEIKDPEVVFVDACISGSPTGQQLLEQVEQGSREIRSHLHASENAHGQRVTRADPSQNPPPCSCYLIMEEQTGRGSHDFSFLASQLPFGLTVSIEGLSSTCRIDYNTVLLEGWFIEQFCQHILIVLSELCQNPERSITHLPLLTLKEEAFLLSRGKGEQRDYPWSKKLHRLFEEQVERTPQARALSYYRSDATQSHLSYQELNMHANEVARELVRLGVRRDVAVGVYMDRSPYAIVSLLAILKAGGIYVPLDASYPLEHLRLIATETEAAVLLTTSHFLKKVSDFGRQMICLDAIEQRITVQSRENVSNETPPDALSLIMYTSGSTGKPKGVRHSQQQIINRLHWMWENYPFVNSDVMCQRSPLGVMPSMMELLAALLRGIPMFIISDPIIKDTPRLVQALIEGRVSYITLVPSLLRLLLKYSEGKEELKSYLRVVTIGGEMFSSLLYKEFRKALPNTLMLFDYGCTETNTILYYTLTGKDVWESTPLPGGHPIANLDVYILDEERQLVPPGIQGEIYVGGRSVSMGYLKRPELTAEKFLHHAFQQHGDEYLYRTGDLGCYLPDGAVKLLGRIDDQIKVNGMRIEPGGVETILNQHELIQESAVTIRTLANGANQLQAFIVKKDHGSLTELEIRQFLETRLPTFMIPARYSFLPALLRTPNGKIDRKALRNYQTITSTATSPRTWNALLTEIRRILAEEFLEIDPSSLDENQAFYVLGLDSVLAVEFARRISTAYGVTLSVTSLYDYPTLKSLADHLLEIQEQQKQGNKLSIALSEQTEITPVISNQIVEKDHWQAPSGDIAIIGMSGRFPQAQDIEEFWRNLAQGICAVTEVPPERWDVGAYYDPNQSNQATSVSRWGAFLDDIDKFEPLFFNISPAEARLMDPQHRLCLEESWKALEHAGYCPDALREQSVGVFVGAKKGDYEKNFATPNTYPHGDVLLGNDLAMQAARIAYHMDFHGPCLTVDTSCSSSLVAVHLASQSLQLQESDIALAGGVCVVTNPQFSVATSKLGILSPTGVCKAFDNDADGFVQGEGVAFIVLKQLSKALHDGDTVYGVIKASAINHDGKTNGIGAPSGRAQTLLQSTLYQKSGINPNSISYVETHGTGTKIGDPIEITALTNSFGQFSQERNYCAIGSLKPNIGHLTAAAGIAGLIKVLLCFKQKQLPPNIHYQIPNEHISFSESPFYVNTVLQNWDVRSGSTRLAAINSFGLGGTNVHCILEEPPQPTRSSQTAKPIYIVPFSARTVGSLKENLSDFQTWIETKGQQYALRDISYTLLVGRKHFPICCVYLATNLADLSQQIRRSCEGDELQADFLNIQSNLPTPDPLLKELADYLMLLLGMLRIEHGEYIQKMQALAALIIKGVPFNGEALFKMEKAYHIPLPTYHFLRERCWFEEQIPEATRSFAKLPDAAAIGESASVTGQKSLSSKNLNETVQQNEGSALHREICKFLSEMLGRLLEIEPTMLKENASLEEYGFDSIRAISLKYELERTFASDVPIELIVQGSTIEVMAKKLLTLPHLSHRQQQQNLVEVVEDTTQAAHLKTQFLNGALPLAELGSEELDALFDQFAGEVERMNYEAR